MEKIKVIITHEGKISRENKFDSGFDVYCMGYRSVNDDFTLENETWFDEKKDITNNRVGIAPNETIMLLTGVQLQMPNPKETENGYTALEVQVRGRSGLSLKKNTNVKLGTGDNTYQGMYGIIFKNESNKVLIIDKGDKVAQLVFNEIYIPKDTGVEYTENFDIETDRGNCGFGSSGK